MDFANILQTWRNVLTRPGEPVFEQERVKPTATFTTAIIWIVIAAVITALLGFVRGALFVGSGMMDQMINQMNLPPEAAQQMHSMLSSGMLNGFMGGAGIASVIFTPIFFLIGVGIFHLIATLLGVAAILATMPICWPLSKRPSRLSAPC